MPRYHPFERVANPWRLRFAVDELEPIHDSRSEGDTGFHHVLRYLTTWPARAANVWEREQLYGAVPTGLQIALVGKW